MESQLTYILIGLCSALGALFTAFALLHLKDLKEINNLKKDLETLRKEKEELEKNTLSSVSLTAKEIVEAANKKAAGIISMASQISEEEKRAFSEAFIQMQNTMLRDYQQTAGKFSRSYDEFILNVGKDIKARLEMGLDKASSDARSQITKTGSEITEALKNLYKGYENEVSEYKKQVLSQIEELGADMIKQVALKVLGKALSKKEQEDLVIKSLEEAKKLGFFQ